MDQKIKQDKCIGSNLKCLRLNSGFTQEQIATKMQLAGMNMSRDFYAHIENGTYNIRTSELVALRKILNCSYENFFADLE
jgi:transcriptional regulator with XRE-family HTH domain